ncbi:MAG: hypothetical protein FWE84_05880 [Firmicutes bacterium]|nr:hypothetical protein [Bacillota bacterium]
MRTITIVKADPNDMLKQQQISDFLNLAGYKFKEFEGEQLWQKGNGWLTAPMFFRLWHDGSFLHIETWIKIPLLPFVFVGESGLDSGYGFAIKIGMRNLLKQILSLFPHEDIQPQSYLPKK